ncbi:hypothetical protein M427DRAFT_34268 [Gonapodya prolifera JEL478]|uniref:Uncharacterized protein n=1 Tax=Gonapodya prolifera (strain JEL478) TaxID=1344416 RepID=A0A139A8A9_GONPJ|nr:hypothetical protein M427DRAFT_34268 [Gonapodya prolifera JEL478]|eukprot:KXS13020.1 hypothetical protein M427DRAFT_34268 [Gonapodya prolifera JEL478]
MGVCGHSHTRTPPRVPSAVTLPRTQQRVAIARENSAGSATINRGAVLWPAHGTSAALPHRSTATRKGHFPQAEPCCKTRPRPKRQATPLPSPTTALPSLRRPSACSHLQTSAKNSRFQPPNPEPRQSPVYTGDEITEALLKHLSSIALGDGEIAAQREKETDTVDYYCQAASANSLISTFIASVAAASIFQLDPDDNRSFPSFAALGVTLALPLTALTMSALLLVHSVHRLRDTSHLQSRQHTCHSNSHPAGASQEQEQE